MGIYSKGMTVRVILTGQYGKVSQTRDYGVMVYVGDDPFETYFELNEVEPVLLVGLAPAPATPPAPAAANRSSYDDDDVDDMIGALLDICELLGLSNVPSGKIVEAVKTVQAENARLRAALEPFAEAWVEFPMNPASKLVVAPPTGFMNFTLGITAKALENAHTVYFHLAPDKE